MLLHNVISPPKVIRHGSELSRAAERRKEVEPNGVAMLEDEISTL